MVVVKLGTERTKPDKCTGKRPNVKLGLMNSMGMTGYERPTYDLIHKGLEGCYIRTDRIIYVTGIEHMS